MVKMNGKAAIDTPILPCLYTDKEGKQITAFPPTKAV